MLASGRQSRGNCYDQFCRLQRAGVRLVRASLSSYTEDTFRLSSSAQLFSQNFLHQTTRRPPRFHQTLFPFDFVHSTRRFLNSAHRAHFLHQVRTFSSAPFPISLPSPFAAHLAMTSARGRTFTPARLCHLRDNSTIPPLLHSLRRTLVARAD